MTCRVVAGGGGGAVTSNQRVLAGSNADQVRPKVSQLFVCGTCFS